MSKFSTGIDAYDPVYSPPVTVKRQQIFRQFRCYFTATLMDKYRAQWPLKGNK